MLKYLKITAILNVLLLSSCANYKLHKSAETKIWEAKEPTPQLALTHSLYLIGDAGAASDAGGKEANAAVKLFKEKLKAANSNSTVLFLGDNLYPSGVPPRADKNKRKAAEAHLDAQVNALENFKGQSYFIPGNHDWYKEGVRGVNRQEKYIEEALNKGVENEEDWAEHFLPDDGCSGPKIVELSDNLILIIVDSQWWLTDWDKEPKINDGCDIKTRAAFAAQFADAIKDYKNQNIVIATHHPIASYGPHGGRTSVKDHLFPLTSISKNLYLPLPGLGSIFQGIRTSGISAQHVNNANNRDLQNALMEPAEANGEYIFVAGHEHTLQYIKKNGQHIVVSGAGSKTSKTTAGKDALLTYGQTGFSKIDFYEDGSAWIEFWATSENYVEGELILRQQMKGPLPKPSLENIPTSFPDYESGAETSNQFPITSSVKDVTKFGNFMLGEHYRKVYLEKYDFPTLDLAKFKGGLRVIKKGGGRQTNSLRLMNKAGQEYVMRSMTKDITRGIPHPFNQMPMITYLFQDSYLATQPFAPLVIPTLSHAANVYHANPIIYYVPKQPVLGIHNDNFGGEVYIVEERASKSWPEMQGFGNAEKFVSTFSLAEKRVSSQNHHIDQNWVARSRLFDLLIGDWDRHEDQWRWTVTPQEGKNKLYRPIPRDRDQAFSKNDGYVVKLLSSYNTFLRQLADYGDELNKPEWGTYNTRFFDHDFLNELSWEEWQKEVAYIQANVTDEVIEKAFAKFPQRVQEISAEEIKRILKVRRNNLPTIAADFYGQLAKKIMVHGSNKKEYFEVKRIDDEHTEVSIFDLDKKGKKKDVHLYHRVVNTSETEEVFLYGLDGDDVFHFSGTANDGVVFRVVGGAGNDEFIDESIVGGGGKKDKFYDSKNGNTLKLGSEGKNLTSNVASNNIYDRRGNQYDENIFFALPLIALNEDDGIVIGLTGLWQKQGFNKSRYARQHKLGGKFAFATKGLEIKYNGVFIESAGQWDFVINTILRNDLYSFNFFGLGNETHRNDELNLDYYRVRQSHAYLDFGWQRRFANDVGLFSIRPMVEQNEIQETNGRFIDSDDNGLDPSDLETKMYGGLVMGLGLENVDNVIAPGKGFRINTEIKVQNNLSGGERQFGILASDFTLYQPFDEGRRVVLASRIGTALIRGDYDFFFAPVLGQKTNLRGFLRDRYRGETSYFHTTDLRITVASVYNPILPFTLGFTGSFDYGRVWQPDENSDLWHSSFGGGIWIAPLNLAIVSLSYHVSDDDKLIAIKLGHAF